MRDDHMWNNNGQPMRIRDMPSHVIEQHVGQPIVIVLNIDGSDDPIYWLRLRLDVELVRRRLGIAIRD